MLIMSNSYLLYLQDLLGGIMLSAVVIFIMLPSINIIENFMMIDPYAPILLILGSLLLSYIFPCHISAWSSSLAEIMAIISASTGVIVGFRISDVIGIFEVQRNCNQCPIIAQCVLKIFLKTFLGFCLVFVMKLASKYCFKMVINLHNYANLRKLLIHYCTYFVVGLTMTFCAPFMFYCLAM